MMATTKPVSLERWVARVHSPENVMPRKKLSRRFEPRFGVSQSMVDVEAKWVERELEDHLLASTNDLRKRLSEIHAKAVTAEEGLKTTIGRLPDRERLALKCMLARDMFHIAALYETFLRSSLVVQNATGVSRRRRKKSIGKANPDPFSSFSNRFLVEVSKPRYSGVLFSFRLGRGGGVAKYWREAAF